MHVGHLAVEVHRHQRVRSWADRSFRTLWVEAVIAFRDIDDDWDAARLCHGFERGNECACRHDDLVSSLKTGRLQTEP